MRTFLHSQVPAIGAAIAYVLIFVPAYQEYLNTPQTTFYLGGDLLEVYCFPSLYLLRSLYGDEASLEFLFPLACFFNTLLIYVLVSLLVMGSFQIYRRFQQMDAQARVEVVFRSIEFGSIVLAVGIACYGMLLTAGLIKEYGDNVNPLALAAQAAVVWAPPTVVLGILAFSCHRYAGTR